MASLTDITTGAGRGESETLSIKLGRELAARHFLLASEETNQLEETLRDVNVEIEIKATVTGES